MGVEINGVDLSKHNGTVDWNKIKAAGVKFAIIRSGFGKADPSQIDGQFEANYAGAKKVGIPIGVYHYSYAKSAADAEKEAAFVIDIIKGKQFEYPIYFDIEDKTQVALSKATCTAIVTAFCNKLEKAGYWAGVYSYDSFFSTHLDASIQQRYAVWAARVENVKPAYCKTYQMWQYSWKGSVNGSSKETDMNICYVDYPTMIKKAKKNGYGTVTYSLTATQSGLTAAEAAQLETRLNDLGFTVSKAVQ